MKDTDKELLSRVLDENISEFETRRMLEMMRADDALNLTMQRYGLIGCVMRRELPERFNQEFVRDVAEQLAKQDIDVVDPVLDDEVNEKKGSNHMKTVAGLAIAASVAVFSFIALQNIFQPEVDPSPDAFVASQEIEQRNIKRVSSAGGQNFISNPEAAANFNSYIMNHAEHASVRVSVPHVRIVGYEGDLEEGK